MQQSHDRLCPWCQTEIVWDPEIGPEEACPHCFSELGNYRSLNLDVEDIDMDEDDVFEDRAEDRDDEELNEYEEGVQRLLATQEDPPECSSCHSFMMFVGKQPMAEGFVPAIPATLDQPILKKACMNQVYVCPSCFKVDYLLAEEDRLVMIELLSYRLT